MKMNFRRFVLTIYLLTLAVVSPAQVLKGTVIDATKDDILYKTYVSSSCSGR